MSHHRRQATYLPTAFGGVGAGAGAAGPGPVGAPSPPSAQQQPFPFGGAVAPAPVAAFGAPQQQQQQQQQQQPVGFFGAAAPAVSVPASPGGVGGGVVSPFPQAQPSAAPQPSPPSAFGAPPQVGTFGAPAASAPAFGVPPAAPAQAFGVPQQQSQQGGFGAANAPSAPAPAFGAPFGGPPQAAPSGGGFGGGGGGAPSPSPAPFGQQLAPPPPFGGPSAPAAPFGTSAPAAVAQQPPPPFGRAAPAAPGAPAFGSPPPAAAEPSPAFGAPPFGTAAAPSAPTSAPSPAAFGGGGGFGGGGTAQQQQQQQQQAPAPSPSFGSSPFGSPPAPAPASVTSSSSPFGGGFGGGGGGNSSSAFGGSGVSNQQQGPPPFGGGGGGGGDASGSTNAVFGSSPPFGGGGGGGVVSDSVRASSNSSPFGNFPPSTATSGAQQQQPSTSSSSPFPPAAATGGDDAKASASSASAMSPTPPGQGQGPGDELARLKAKIREKKRRLEEQKRLKERMQREQQQQQEGGGPSSSSSPVPNIRTPTRDGDHDRDRDRDRDIEERNRSRFADDARRSTTALLPPDLQKRASSNNDEDEGDSPYEDSTTGGETEEDDDVVDVTAVAPTRRRRLSSRSGKSAGGGGLVGTCPYMCPDAELLQREREGDVQLLELMHPSVYPKEWTLRDTVVKRFRRSAADYRLDVPELVRPPRVLERVCGYLEEWVMERDRQGPDPRYSSSHIAKSDTPPPLDVYQFVWDRTRMVRKDFILQNYTAGIGGRCDAVATRCHERIARWHAMVEHQLSHIPDYVAQQSQQNIQELGQTMKTLNQYYDDALGRSTVEHPTRPSTGGGGGSADESFQGCRSDVVHGPNPVDYDGRTLSNVASGASRRIVGRKSGDGAVPASSGAGTNGTAEPEMRGLYILLTMHNDGGMEVLKYAAQLCETRPAVFRSRPVQLALDIYRVRKERNYARFFHLLRSESTPYLFACIMFKYVEEMRKVAFKIMSRTYGARRKDNGKAMYDAYPLQNLVHLLCYEDKEEARNACEHYGIAVRDVPASATAMADNSDNSEQLPPMASGSGGHGASSFVLWRHADFREPKDPTKGITLQLRPRKMIRTIESKLNGATRLAVCRGEVSGAGAALAEPVVVSSARAQSSSMSSSAMIQSGEDMDKLRESQESRREREIEVAKAAAAAEAERARLNRLRQEQEAAAAKRRVVEAEKEKERMEKMRLQQEKAEAERLRLERLAQRQREIQRMRAEAEEARQREEQRKRDMALRAEQERREREKEELRRKKEEEERRMEMQRQAERLETERRRALAEERERERLRLLALQREKEERERREAEERRLREERERAEELRRQQLMKEQEERRRIKEEEERIAKEWERKMTHARKLLAWRRWRRALRGRHNLVATKRSMAEIDPTYRSSSEWSTSFSRLTSSGSSQQESARSSTTCLERRRNAVSEQFFSRLGKEAANHLDCARLLSVHVRRANQHYGQHSSIQERKRAHPTGRHAVILWKLAVLLPQGHALSSVNRAVLSWLDSRLRFGLVCVGRVNDHSTVPTEVRTVVVDATSVPQAVKGCDAALFVIPPFDHSQADGDIKFAPGSIDNLPVEAPRMVMLMRNSGGIEACCDQRLAGLISSALGMCFEGDLKMDGIANVKVHPSFRNDVDEALSACCEALMTACEENIGPEDQVKVERISFARLGRKCIREILWSDAAVPSNSNVDECKAVLQAVVLCLEVLSQELSSYGLALNGEAIRCWPAMEFCEDGAVPRYFGEYQRDYLPHQWWETLSSTEVENGLQEAFSPILLAETDRSVDSIVRRLLKSAPAYFVHECEMLLSRKLFRRCLETVMLWQEDHHSACQERLIYLPKGALDYVVGRTVGRVCESSGRNSVESIDSGLHELTEFRGNSKSRKHREQFWPHIDLESSAPRNLVLPEASPSLLSTPAKSDKGASAYRGNSKRRTEGDVDEGRNEENVAGSRDAKRHRFAFSRDLQESSAFTSELEAILHGGATFDFDVGSVKLSKLLADKNLSIALPDEMNT